MLTNEIASPSGRGGDEVDGEGAIEKAFLARSPLIRESDKLFVRVIYCIHLSLL